MKTFRLLIVSLLLATSASAQHHRGERRGGDYSPTVYLISVHEVDTIYNCGGCAAQQAAALNRMAVGNATQDYIDTHRPGFQQTEKPQFVFASKNNRFSFSIGGFVSRGDSKIYFSASRGHPICRKDSGIRIQTASLPDFQGCTLCSAQAAGIGCRGWKSNSVQVLLAYILLIPGVKINCLCPKNKTYRTKQV